MLICVTGIDQSLELQMAHIIQPFIEDARIEFTMTQEVSLHIDLTINVGEHTIETKAELFDMTKEKKV